MIFTDLNQFNMLGIFEMLRNFEECFCIFLDQMYEFTSMPEFSPCQISTASEFRILMLTVVTFLMNMTECTK